MTLRNILSTALLLIFVLHSALPAFAQSPPVFEKVELLVANGDRIGEKSARLKFLDGELQIETLADGAIAKSFKYAEIKDAEYSYSKSPRWKTGLGLGAASIVFPPLLLVAIPVGFTKHRRHWLTIKTETDYAVIKLSKSNRKLILPAFETRTGVRIDGRGENK